MSKLVKVNHVVLGLKVAANGGGYTQEEIDKMVNDRLKEYDDVEIFPLRTQFGEQGAPADFVSLYIFKKYAEDTPVSAKVK